ncbi:heterokaryon incompatibility protein-domain-containing protein [Amylocarpus encephaloides]|uniref:Heterokaryon incompatibility protein-domain-containing protein n=1 Tax=Amylocarpus encephaloides TaxID=45428 RepID=A0A9P8C102_9HELO|nr:heterokaryon incompatibility protein-domain-containing protein [Amylocarpus encephaloides]
MIKLSKLCSTCGDMFNGNSLPCQRDILKNAGYRLHQTSPTHFRAAALQKCFICSQNWAKVPEPYRLRWEKEEDNTRNDVDFMRYRFVRNTHETVTETVTEPTEFLALEILWNNMDPLKSWSTFYHLVPTQRLEITAVDDQLIASFRSDQTFSGSSFLNHGSSTSSLRSLQLIKEWCSDCEKNHDAYRMKSTDDVPTRLIEIGTTEWRLCHTAKEACTERVKFVALSYRWPKVPSIRLLKSTEPIFRRGQQIFALPQLFQDAMEVAVYLGVRYIWLGALCIIQDSLDDWSYESARMTNVYANSYCTIAAAASADPNDSLFKERSPEDILSGIAECNTTQGNVPVIGTFAILERDSWHREFEASVLQLRGWCFQERILAPRTIHFATPQLLWECDAILQNETFRNKFPYPRLAPTIRASSIRQSDQNESGILASGIAFKEWANIVESYSRCALTEANDKLVAISGLASLYHKRTNDTYFAGIWQYNLLDYLLWMSAP